MHLALLSTLALFIPSASESVPAETARPELLLQTDGAPIDLASGFGHAGPLVLDLDGAAPLDLLVGDLKGHLHAYLGRKMDQKTDPKTGQESGGATRYEPMGPLEFEGKPIRVHNW